ncbi:MAG: MBOAT family protein [Lachnospiraceae bacterium]|nr:MBOAT family protein [Lachnospiraceae bacterium]
MVFSSIYFVFLFFPIVLALYYAVSGRARNAVLLIASLVFYAYGEPVFVFVLMGSVLVNYLLALAIASLPKGSGRKGLFITDIILNIGLLFIYKYLGFSAGLLSHLTGLQLPLKDIALPLGISFFTFQALSYVADVYRGQEPRKNVFELALYICFFPQLVAGPIVRYTDIKDQLCAKDRLSRAFSRPKLWERRLTDMGEGIERFILGFSKKVLIANQVAVIADSVFDTPDFSTVSPGMAWLGSVCYTLQIYYDFSGYSDMAIGLGRMFGFRVPENFDHPFISGSVTEFWRRWHISLSSWFKDYVYIPLGGSRVKRGRRIFNLLVVWLLTGIWHGANLTFMAWGLLYFVLLVLEKYLIRPERFKNLIIKLVYRAFTLLSVSFLWVLFRAESLAAGIVYIARMFGAFLQVSGEGVFSGISRGAVSVSGVLPVTSGSDFAMYMREYGIFLLAAVIFCCPIRGRIMRKAGEKTGILYAAVLLFLFIWSVSYLLLGMHNPFLYFNF